MPGFRRKTVPSRRETPAPETSGSSAATSSGEGTRCALKSHAFRRAPTVGSKRPPDSFHRSSAAPTRKSVSSSTATGVRPASRLIAETTLVSRKRENFTSTRSASLSTARASASAAARPRRSTKRTTARPPMRAKRVV